MSQSDYRPPCHCGSRRPGEGHRSDCFYYSGAYATYPAETPPSPPAAADQVNNPPHYGGADNPYEAIKVIEAWLTPEQFHGFCIGNVAKYLSRAGRKEGEPTEKDLRKAAWYLDRAIEKRLKQ